MSSSVSVSGRRSGGSAQHWRMTLTASGGAAPIDTDGRISGGGRTNFSTISATKSKLTSAPVKLPWSLTSSPYAPSGDKASMQ